MNKKKLKNKLMYMSVHISGIDGKTTTILLMQLLQLVVTVVIAIILYHK